MHIRAFLINRHLEGSVADGRILLKRSLRSWHGGVNYIQVVPNSVQRRGMFELDDESSDSTQAK
jgi:hypothetical protein